MYVYLHALHVQAIHHRFSFEILYTATLSSNVYMYVFAGIDLVAILHIKIYTHMQT